jgi:hypothetical protein
VWENSVVTVRVARLVALIGVVVMAVWVQASPVSAGGSFFSFDRDHYLPGDTAFGWATVAWEHNPQLGTPEQGPYYAYLAREGDLLVDGQFVPPGAPRVAELRISLDAYEQGGIRFGPHHATIQFTVPDLPPGRYWIAHCNVDCTTTLGDITGGNITIGPAAIPPPPPTTVPPVTTPTSPVTTTTTTIADEPDDAESSGPHPLVVGGAATAVIGGISAGAYARHRRRS